MLSGRRTKPHVRQHPMVFETLRITPAHARDDDVPGLGLDRALPSLAAPCLCSRRGVIRVEQGWGAVTIMFAGSAASAARRISAAYLMSAAMRPGLRPSKAAVMGVQLRQLTRAKCGTFSSATSSSARPTRQYSLTVCRGRHAAQAVHTVARKINAAPAAGSFKKRSPSDGILLRDSQRVFSPE